MIDAEPSLRAAEGIGAPALVAYLLETGWTAVPSRVEGVSILSKPVANASEPVSFILPVGNGSSEERRRVADALRAVEVVEHRPLKAIARDVRSRSQAIRDDEAAERFQDHY